MADLKAIMIWFCLWLYLFFVGISADLKQNRKKSFRTADVLNKIQKQEKRSIRSQTACKNEQLQLANCLAVIGLKCNLNPPLSADMCQKPLLSPSERSMHCIAITLSNKIALKFIGDSRLCAVWIQFAIKTCYWDLTHIAHLEIIASSPCAAHKIEFCCKFCASLFFLSLRLSMGQT